MGALCGKPEADQDDEGKEIRPGSANGATKAASKPPVDVRVAAPPAVEVSGWSAGEVAAWLQTEEGVSRSAASTLQGLSGAQLLQLTEKELEEQFYIQDDTARQQVLAARDRLLSVPERSGGGGNGSGSGSKLRSGLRGARAKGAAALAGAGGKLPPRAPPAAPPPPPPPLPPPPPPPLSESETSKHNVDISPANSTPTPEATPARRSFMQQPSFESQSSGLSQSAVNLVDRTSLQSMHSNVSSHHSIMSRVSLGTSLKTLAELHAKGVPLQMVKITPGGRLIRATRNEVPLALLPVVGVLLALHYLKRQAYYNVEPSRQLLRRCVLVQDALEVRANDGGLLPGCPVLLRFEDMLLDAKQLIWSFSKRGWLLRLAQPVTDQRDFERLDARLLAVVTDAGLDPATISGGELLHPGVYETHSKAAVEALVAFGGMRAVAANPAAAAEALKPFVTVPPALRSGGGAAVSPTAGRTGANGEGTSLVAVLTPLVEAEGRLWASSAPVVRSGVDAPPRPPACRVLRHPELRVAWWRAFGSRRESVVWRDFWRRMAAANAAEWGLEGSLDKFSQEYLQRKFERGRSDRVDLAKLDFVFEPRASMRATVAGLLAMRAGSSSRLASVGFSTDAPPPGAGLEEEPSISLHNFPELPPGSRTNGPRCSEVADLALSMQDISTSLLLVSGQAGLGKTALAASLGSQLVSESHWTEAYWVDLQGVMTARMASVQLLAALGLMTDAPDPQHILAWLENRQERFGVVLVNAGELLGAPGEGPTFMELLENMSQACRKLQLVLVAQERLQQAAYIARTVDVVPLPLDDVVQQIRQAAPEADPEDVAKVAAACAGFPLAVTVASGVLRHGYCTATDFLRLHQEQALPSRRNLSQPQASGEVASGDAASGGAQPGPQRTSSGGAAAAAGGAPPSALAPTGGSNVGMLAGTLDTAQDALHRCIMVAALSLPDELISALLVVSMVPAPFSYSAAADLLPLQVSDVERSALLRRLQDVGLLLHHPGRQMYSVHPSVCAAVGLLASALGLSYQESRRHYAEWLLRELRTAVLPLWDAGLPLAAHLAWSWLEMLNWVFMNKACAELLPSLVDVAWEAWPLLVPRCSHAFLQGFCQLAMDRANALGMVVESAQLSTLMGSLLTEAGAVKRADTLLRTALEALWNGIKEGHPLIVRCYQELGTVCLRSGKLNEAGTNFQQALDMADALWEAANEAAAPPGDDKDSARQPPTPSADANPHVLPLLALLMEVRRRQRKFGEAEELGRRAAVVAAKVFGPSHPEVAATNNNLAQVMRFAGRYSEAEALHNQALSLLEPFLGQQHPAVAATLVQMGQLAVQLGNPPRAEQLLRKALQVLQSTQGVHHSETSACLAQLVSMLRSAGKASTALPLAQSWLSSKTKTLGPNHPDVAAAMQGVAEVMLDLGSYTEVERLCAKAAGILQLQPGAGVVPSRALLTLHTMQALSLTLLGRPKEAAALARKCLDLVEKLPTEGPEREAFRSSALNCLAEALRELGSLEEAEEQCRKGLAIREKNFGREHGSVALSLCTLSAVLRARGELQAALDAAVRCAAIRTKAAKGGSGEGPLLAAALQQQALALLDMDSNDEALALATRALDMRVKAIGADHPDAAHSLTAIGEALMAMDRLPEAHQKLSQAADIFMGRLGKNHPTTKRAALLVFECQNPAAFLARRERQRQQRLQQAEMEVQARAELGRQQPPPPRSSPPSKPQQFGRGGAAALVEAAAAGGTPPGAAAAGQPTPAGGGAAASSPQEQRQSRRSFDTSFETAPVAVPPRARFGPTPSADAAAAAQQQQAPPYGSPPSLLPDADPQTAVSGGAQFAMWDAHRSQLPPGAPSPRPSTGSPALEALPTITSNAVLAQDNAQAPAPAPMRPPPAPGTTPAAAAPAPAAGAAAAAGGVWKLPVRTVSSASADVATAPPNAVELSPGRSISDTNEQQQLQEAALRSSAAEAPAPAPAPAATAPPPPALKSSSPAAREAVAASAPLPPPMSLTPRGGGGGGGGGGSPRATSSSPLRGVGRAVRRPPGRTARLQPPARPLNAAELEATDEEFDEGGARGEAAAGEEEGEEAAMEAARDEVREMKEYIDSIFENLLTKKKVGAASAGAAAGLAPLRGAPQRRQPTRHHSFIHGPGGGGGGGGGGGFGGYDGGEAAFNRARRAPTRERNRTVSSFAANAAGAADLRRSLIGGGFPVGRTHSVAAPLHMAPAASLALSPGPPDLEGAHWDAASLSDLESNYGGGGMGLDALGLMDIRAASAYHPTAYGQLGPSYGMYPRHNPWLDGGGGDYGPPMPPQYTPAPPPPSAYGWPHNPYHAAAPPPPPLAFNPPPHPAYGVPTGHYGSFSQPLPQGGPWTYGQPPPGWHGSGGSSSTGPLSQHPHAGGVHPSRAVSGGSGGSIYSAPGGMPPGANPLHPRGMRQVSLDTFDHLGAVLDEELRGLDSGMVPAADEHRRPRNARHGGLRAPVGGGGIPRSASGAMSSAGGDSGGGYARDLNLPTPLEDAPLADPHHPGAAHGGAALTRAGSVEPAVRQAPEGRRSGDGAGAGAAPASAEAPALQRHAGATLARMQPQGSSDLLPARSDAAERMAATAALRAAEGPPDLTRPNSASTVGSTPVHSRHGSFVGGGGPPPSLASSTGRAPSLHGYGGGGARPATPPQAHQGDYGPPHHPEAGGYAPSYHAAAAAAAAGGVSAAAGAGGRPPPPYSQGSGDFGGVVPPYESFTRVSPFATVAGPGFGPPRPASRAGSLTAPMQAALTAQHSWGGGPPPAHQYAASGGPLPAHGHPAPQHHGGGGAGGYPSLPVGPNGAPSAARHTAMSSMPLPPPLPASSMGRMSPQGGAAARAAAMAAAQARLLGSPSGSVHSVASGAGRVPPSVAEQQQQQHHHHHHHAAILQEAEMMDLAAAAHADHAHWQAQQQQHHAHQQSLHYQQQVAQHQQYQQYLQHQAHHHHHQQQQQQQQYHLQAAQQQQQQYQHAYMARGGHPMPGALHAGYGYGGAPPSRGPQDYGPPPGARGGGGDGWPQPHSPPGGGGGHRAHGAFQGVDEEGREIAEERQGLRDIVEERQLSGEVAPWQADRTASWGDSVGEGGGRAG